MKKILHHWTTAVLPAAAIALAATVATAQEKPEALSIGVFTFTSGPAAAYGMPGKQAAELMIERINADGGVAGVPIEATYVDEAQGAEGVISEYRSMAEDQDNQVMIAALSSGNCLALAPLAEQLKMPTIAWNCDTHQLLRDSELKYTYRPNGNTLPEFTAFVAYLLERQPDVKRVAIINPDYSFGHDAADIVKTALATFAPDVEIVAELFPKLGASTYQTEISRLSSARPDAIFSNLWGADLENFVRQAGPRGIFQQSQVILALGETVLQRVDLPDGVIVGMLGDGYWLSPDAQSKPDTVAFAEAYHERYGEYPVFPSMKMANALVVMKAAVEKAVEDKNGEWPSRDEIVAALEGMTVETMTGETSLREDNDGIVDQVIGVTTASDSHEFKVIGDMVRYDGEAFMAPVGEEPVEWIKSLEPSFLDTLPAAGSYK
ncbi:ABC transporter substrate-binding protein [Pseudohoeflea coraliihabitans]|uniref:ABC transporter substrate-binding protein n=1 Tax=Pseudohoeflea coraliihabitans TaxID=2860393 RepID=A0ABS6WSY7_9HYPH|nr:ABC transporter substrate-binding protein [Pseudohoeflea sp. DP4N28-3]MBW3098159.1 ABC transporter substrate-binding protein [Pseudohoeflea sp. DP4N28-3]